ncbi:shikimate kinase [Reichenbachiella agarivorans]|uniref:Shikimate kinase n=1 Tax=Reichenbachiella agarivorans TaxID=2979464 RepID=A0ABY6CT05_9BACT|nr:shikimate kinase [Reichenbachiella agarivorans]UXP33651.1 shikimate kinase [Reichenbachiella agarivorans]
MTYPKKIFLVGMPGSGKSTFGKLLADQLGRQFFDLDEQIEKMSGMSIPDIFEDAGEDQFRMFETYALSMITQLNEPALIATGGGAPCFNGNMDFMNQSGCTIFLDTPLKTIIERVTKDRETRPLVKKMAKSDVTADMTSLYERRLKFYQQAAFTSDSNMKEIISYLESL